MDIIGLNFGEFNSSACFIRNGKVEIAIQEERFNREKKTKLFPKKSLKYILDISNLKLKEINAFAQSWNPGAKWVNFNPMISKNRFSREEYFYTVADNLYEFIERSPKDYVIMECGGDLPPIYFVQHHRCHAANAFFLSNFQKAAFLTADWQGELECITKGLGNANNLEVIDTQWLPHSIGLFYATFTQLLGYKPDNDEWKVMALSAVDTNYREYEKRILKTINFLPNGNFELDQTYFTGTLLDQPNLFSEKFFSILDIDIELEKKNKDEIWQCKVAKAMQKVAEKIIWHILNDLWEKTKVDSLVLSGGFFMNSVLNGKVEKNTPFKNVFISHSPDDSGNSIGAALYVNHCILNFPRVKSNTQSNLGPSYSSKEIENSLKRRRIQFKILKNPEKEIAKLLYEENIVAIFQGKIEFGDRALGYRSILGDPRNSKTKDLINSMIKYRESYRPFAPAAIFEKAHEIFEVDKSYICEYMEKVVGVRKEWQKKIPAVTHFDGSARLQTVEKNKNKYFYNVINEFYKLSNIPVVLNTSFNVNGEPIVLSPDDALTTFFNSGLEYLILNKFLITKN